MGAATADPSLGEAGYANPEFWVIPKEGPPVQRLRSLPPLPDPAPFTWMPDSRRVVFAGEFREGTAGTHLWMADTRGTAYSSITTTSGAEQYPAVLAMPVA